MTSTLVMTIWFKSNRIINFYIIFISLVLCFYLIAHGYNNYKSIEIDCKIWSFNYYQIVVFLTPSVYLFFKKLIINSKYPEINDLRYFIFPLCFSYYLRNENFQYFLIEEVVVTIVCTFYILFFVWKSYQFLKPYLWNDYYEVDILNPIVKNWANFVFRLMVLVKIHFLIFLISNFFTTGYVFKLILESGLLAIFLIGYFKVVFTPSLLYGTRKLEQIANVSPVFFVNKVWLSEPNKRIISLRDIKIHNRILDKIPSYIEGVESIALINYSFRKLDYSINDLSVEIGLPKYYLEFIFKYYCKVSFNDYKKVVRIFDAVTLINQGYLSANTLETLSRHVGFASYNPFLINFKEIVGVPPFDYYKRKNVILFT
jgi:AraC-like DNA-binding protein